MTIYTLTLVGPITPRFRSNARMHPCVDPIITIRPLCMLSLSLFESRHALRGFSAALALAQTIALVTSGGWQCRSRRLATGHQIWSAAAGFPPLGRGKKISGGGCSAYCSPLKRVSPVSNSYSSTDRSNTIVINAGDHRQEGHKVHEPQKSTVIQPLFGEARRAGLSTEEGEYRLHQDLYEGKKTRFVSRVMYDGTNYNGFQLQNNGQPTVQGVLETTLSRRFQQHIPVMGAGRTDSGVHATGQAIHFDLPNADTDLGELQYVMNQMMPEDVRVWNMSLAPPCTAEQAEQHLPWHVMLNAKAKIYSYRLCVGDVQNPLDRMYRVHANRAARARVNADLIHDVMPLFVGKHDFEGFANDTDKFAAQKMAAGLGEFNTWREVYSADVIDEGGGNLRLVFHLDGALYRMVRNMVGTVLAVASGRAGNDIVHDIFKTGVRDTRKIYCAPPHGLTLDNVVYDGYG